jgi:Skp family chaperone for outer membrane proteins
VKRKAGLIAAVAALGVGIYFGSRLWAQQPAAAQAPAQTRVAVVNIIQVIKNFHKFKVFNEEMAKLAKPYEDEDKKLLDNIKQWKDAMEKPGFPADKRAEGEQAVKTFQRQREDNAAKAKQVLSKRNDEQMVQLYHEVEDAVKRFALSNGFHVVMAYDEKPGTETYHPQNIQRKLQGAAGTGCAFLIHSAPGLDITQGVVASLNGAVAAAPAGKQ